MVLPLDEASWAGGGRPADTVVVRSVLPHPGSCHLRGASMALGTERRLSRSALARGSAFPRQPWSGSGVILPEAVTEVELIAKSNWMLTSQEMLQSEGSY